jgi:DNA-binding XRE family transcriptional regulator
MIAAIGEGVNTLELYERIRLLRKDYLHMSQTEFGIKLGVSRSVIKNIELDALARPDQKLSLIKLMCKEFSVNEEWLLHGSMPMFVTPETFSLDQYLKERGCTALEMEIVKAYFELDFDTRQKVFDHFQARLSAAKEQLTAAADAGQQQEAKAPQEMTDAELHAELDRQLLEEKRQAGGQLASGPGRSETATG